MPGAITYGRRGIFHTGTVVRYTMLCRTGTAYLLSTGALITWAQSFVLPRAFPRSYSRAVIVVVVAVVVIIFYHDSDRKHI